MKKSLLILSFWIMLFGDLSRAADFGGGDGLISGETLSPRELELYLEINPDPAMTGQNITLSVIGRVAPGMHLYSVFPQGRFGPIQTKVEVERPGLIEREEITESKPKKILDQAFDLSLEVHENDFWIKKGYQVPPDMKKGDYQLEGYLSYQICDNKICSLPQKKKFGGILHVNH